jgi:hypothetical protein
VAAPSARPAAPSVRTSDPGAFSFGTCGNYGAGLTGRFCAECGEKKLTPKDYTLGHFIEETIDGLTHLDSRFLRTLRLLLSKPGELSNAFFHGGRSRYTKPLSLFIIINIVFFFLQPHTGLFANKYANYVANPGHHAAVRDHLRKTGETEEAYRARFNTNLQQQKKSLFIVAVPLLALCMLVVFAGTGRTYAEHLVFSVQVYAFLLVFLAALVLVVLFPIFFGLASVWPSVRQQLWWIQTENSIDFILLIALAIYMYLGFRRAYRVSRVRAGISAVALAYAAGMTIGAYNVALFYMTFWTT